MTRLDWLVHHIKVCTDCVASKMLKGTMDHAKECGHFGHPGNITESMVYIRPFAAVRFFL